MGIIYFSFFFIYYLIVSSIALSYQAINYNSYNRNIIKTLDCLNNSSCKQKCLKLKNTRTIQLKYKDNDYPHPFPYPYYFIHNYTCKFSTLIYIVIISECKQVEERNAIRSTWGKNSKYITINYIIGIGKIDCYLNYYNENKVNGDMLQINIEESFANETLFSIYTMKYLNKLCPYAKYYGKFDVDTYVNIKKLLNEIKPKEDKKFQFWGAEKQKWKKINSNQLFKYSSPKQIADYYNPLFPRGGIDVYSGFATLFTYDIPSIIYNCSLNYPKLIRIDDQYISWILFKLKININKISSYAILPNRCTIYKNVSVIHRITSIDLISYSLFYNNIDKSHSNYTQIKD